MNSPILIPFLYFAVVGRITGFDVSHLWSRNFDTRDPGRCRSHNFSKLTDTIFPLEKKRIKGTR